MFQDINLVKSAPFALLTISQKSMYSPKVFKMPPFSANCTKFAQFANHNDEPREIRMIITNFYHSLLLKYTPTFYSKSREIRPIR